LEVPIEQTKRSGSLAARAFWFTFARTLGFAFSFAIPLILIRWLDQTEFGLYKQAFLIVNTALTMLPLGFSMTALYFIPREREAKRQGQIALNIVLFNATIGAIALLILVLFPQTIERLVGSPELTVYAPVIGAVILFSIIASFLEVAPIAREETAVSTAFIAGSQLTKTLFMSAAAVLFTSVEGLIYASLVQSVLQTFVLLIYLHSRFGFFWRGFDAKLLRHQLAYALPLGFAGLLYVMQNDLHNFFVSNEFGPDLFAIYAIGCFQLPLVAILGESVGAVTIPLVARLQQEGRPREIIELMARAIRKLAAVYFPLYFLLLVTGREFLVVLFTEQYLASWPVFAVNLFLIPMAILGNAFDPVIRAHAEYRYFLLKVRAVLLALLVVVLWFYTPRLGLVGVIATVVVMNLIERLITFIKAARIVGAGRSDVLLLKDVGKIVIASALAGGVAFAVRAFLGGSHPFLTLILCGAAFALAYLIFISLFGVLTSGEREKIRSHLSRFGLFGAKQTSSPLAAKAGNQTEGRV
jgi:O-antigen/teichoic acid export membrane protein